MKSTLDNSGNLERNLNIEIPAQEVNKAFKDFYDDVRKNVTIKGFRKGKTPLEKIKQIYAKEAEQDVVKKLVNENYFSALSEHSLNPISYPHFDFKGCSEGEDFHFTAKFEVKPEIKIENEENIEVEKEILEVTEESIKEVIEDLRANGAKEVPIFEDRPAQKGDIADVDFEGSIDGEKFEGGAAQGHTLELGSNSFIAGFEEGIIGMKVGIEMDLNLKFPDDYHSEQFAGKDVGFKVKLNALKKKETAELNEDFFKQFGPDIKTEDEFNDFIKKGLNEREEKRPTEELRDRIINKLVELNPVEAPPSLVTQQKTAVINDTWAKMQQQGMTEEQFEEYKTKWASDFEKSAAFMVKATFLIDELAQKHKLRASEEDFNKKVEEISGQMGFPVDQLKEFYGAEDKKGNLMFTITQDNVLDYLISKANLKEVAKDKLTPVEK